MRRISSQAKNARNKKLNPTPDMIIEDMINLGYDDHAISQYIQHGGFNLFGNSKAAAKATKARPKVKPSAKQGKQDKPAKLSDDEDPVQEAEGEGSNDSPRDEDPESGVFEEPGMGHRGRAIYISKGDRDISRGRNGDREREIQKEIERDMDQREIQRERQIEIERVYVFAQQPTGGLSVLAEH